MKILWIVNMLLPEAADFLSVQTGKSGTWMINLSKALADDEEIELAIACVYGDQFRDFNVGKIRYFCIPGDGKTLLFYNKNIIKYWDIIEKEFNPDIVHLHGTEYSHGISYLRKYKDKKKILTIQGIIDKISQNQWGGLPLSVLIKFRTLKETIKMSGTIERKILARKNVKYEKEIIKSVQYVTGRTDWDKNYIKTINPSIEYFRCYYDLREEFYSAQKWNIDEVQRNVIYASTSAQMPSKGGHIVIEALNIVKNTIPDVKAIFLCNSQKDGKLIPNSGYTKYIAHLIKKYNLENNVYFIPGQDGQGIIDLMTHSHLTIVPSAMENASATLREAMHLGAPCIASFRGGMVELIDDGKNGCFFDFMEHEYLAGKIIELLNNDEKIKKFSEEAVKKSAQWHDRDKNKKSYIDLYKKIMNCSRIDG